MLPICIGKAHFLKGLANILEMSNGSKVVLFFSMAMAFFWFFLAVG